MPSPKEEGRGPGRDIRFRAWVKSQGVMLNWYGNQQEIKDAIPDDCGDEWTEDCVLMQFTGLTNKNGQEIYEGDILTAAAYPYQDDGRPNYHAVVEWEGVCFITVKRLVNAARRGISDGLGEILEDDAPWEVIGNIYENPDILGSA